MKKIIISLFVAIAATLLFAIAASAGQNYTIPQCSTPPTIDGKYSETEWYGAYHKFMNNEKGNYDYSDNPNPTKEYKAKQCKGYDIYMYWYKDPNESGALLDVKQGGLYICIVAQDKTYGAVFEDGGAANGTDCIQIAIDPFNRKQSTKGWSYIFDFAPETTKKGTALIYEHYMYESKPMAAFKYSVKAIRNKNGYTMEIFLPWSILNINDRIPKAKVGTKMGIGFIVMDWEGLSPYYDITDFGNGKDIVSIADNAKLYNTVTFGDTVYRPGESGGDLTKITKLIKTTDAIVAAKADYLESTYSVFELALTEAKAMISSNTQAEIDAAYTKLDTAIKGLKKASEVTPFEALTATIESASLFVESDYHEETWTRFAAALEAAKKLTEKSAEADINAAVEELNFAISGLVPVDEELESIDKQELVRLIQTIKALKEDAYTADSWKTLQEALTKANEVNGSDTVVQLEVDEAYAALEEAYKALVKVDGTNAAETTVAGDEANDGATGSFPIWLIIVIAVAVVGAAGVVFFFIVRKRR